MQLHQLHELGAAQGAYRVLTATPPYPPLANMPATFTQQVQTLGSLISQVEGQASAQTSATGGMKDKVSAVNTAVKELRSGLLVPLRKVAKLIVKGSTGGGLSPEFASTITIPFSSNPQGLVAAARAAVTNVTPYKDLFTARGMPVDFLDQISAQADAVTQAIQAVHDSKTARTGATVGLKQLLREIRSTVQVLDVSVQQACKKDRENGPTTKTAWETAKSVRKAPIPTDVPWPPASSSAKSSAATATSSVVSTAATSAPSTSSATPAGGANASTTSAASQTAMAGTPAAVTS